VPEEEIDIAEAALIAAAFDREECDLTSYRAHLAEIAKKVAALAPDLAPDDADGRAEALRAVIAEEYSYCGDTLTYHDMQNASLLRVIDRRKGLPVALAIIYLHAARAQGWRADGINFPGHFLIRVEAQGARVIIDPFNGGIERNVRDLRDFLKQMSGVEVELAPEHYAPITNRGILIRLLNNIKLRALSAGELNRATDIIERMLIVAPGEAALLREAGLCHSRLGNLRRAREALEQFVERAEDAAARQEAEAILRDVRAKLN